MEVERQYRAADGKVVWVSSRVSALRDYGAAGRLIGYMDVCRDITERKNAEQALKLSRERYALATGVVRVGVWDWDLRSGEFYLDPNLKSLLGYRDGELAAEKNTWINLIFPDDHSSARQAIRECIEGRADEYANEMQIRLPGGETRWLAVRGRSIRDQSGKPVRILGTGSDITQRKRMEAQIQAAQMQLAQAARLASTGELASGVAHHINNPLTTIIAETQILMQHLDEHDAWRESVQAIEQAGWRVQRAVQKLIDYSQPGTERMEALEVNHTIRTALDLIGDLVFSNYAHLEVSLSENLPLVRANGRQLVDLWMNLLLMARDATCIGGEHRVEVRSALAPGGGVQVEVWDDGEPISEEDMKAIFEPGFYGGSGGRGKGYAMSICQVTVRQQIGQMAIESSPGRCTTIRISFPLEG
jgi:PAS domain S-box-containing protein